MAKNPLDSINQRKTASDALKHVSDMNIVSVPFSKQEEIKKETKIIKKELKAVSPMFKSRETNNKTVTNVRIEDDILNILKQNILNEKIKSGSYTKIKDYVNNILESYINSNK